MIDNIVKFKSKDDYETFTKTIDGKEVTCVNIDALTEDQWKKYCKDTGSEYFKRLNVSI